MSIQSERISALMQEKGISYGKLSNATGIPKSALQRYATGETKKIPLDRLESIAKALDASPAYLMGLNSSLADELPEGASPYNPVVRRIPILGYISAGLPLYAQEHIEGCTYTDCSGGGEYFALRVKGDSMNAAKINDGDLLIVRRQETVENGEIAVVMVGLDEATVKRFKRDGNTVQLIPQSYNPIHQIQLYDLKKTRVKIIGKVVKCEIRF